MAGSSNPEPCPICKEDIGNGSEVSTIDQKGANGMNAASTQRGDRIVVEAGVKVYTDCRKLCTNPQQIERKLSVNLAPISPAKTRTRDAKDLFNNKTDCFFCEVTIQPESSDYSNVKTDTFADSILNIVIIVPVIGLQLLKFELNISAEIFMQQIVYTTILVV